MIDWVRLEELREEVGADDFCDVVEIFLEEVDAVVERLHPDAVESLEDDLHFLKGSALNLGFDAFAGLCQAGETAARNGQGATVDVEAVKDCYQTSRAIFLRGVDKFGCSRGLSSVA